MKRVTLFSCLFFLVFLAQAQTSVAIIGGLHGSTVTPGFYAYPDTSTKKAASNKMYGLFGFLATVTLKKNLCFQTGVIFTAKGSDWSQVYDTANLYQRTKDLPFNKKQQLLSTNTILNIQYIEMPLNLLYRFPLGAKTRFLLGAGSQLSLLYNGKTQSNSWYVSKFHPDSAVRLSFKGHENNDLPIGNGSGRYRILHFNAKAIGGLEIGRVSLMLNYTRDLNEFYEENGRYYKAQTLGASLGIRLGRESMEGSRRNDRSTNN